MGDGLDYGRCMGDKSPSPIRKPSVQHAVTTIYGRWEMICVFLQERPLVETTGITTSLYFSSCEKSLSADHYSHR